MSLTCVIVDDSEVFARTASRLLERQGMTVLGVAVDGAAAARMAAELRPDVLLVDVDIAGESGLALVVRLARESDHPPLMILISTHAEEVYADLVDETPALGFLSKSALSAAAVERLLARRPTDAGS